MRTPLFDLPVGPESAILRELFESRTMNMATQLTMIDKTSRAKRLLILASKLGYQTRGFAEAAEKLGVDVVFGTDRCHKLEDPWGDRAHPLHFEAPQEAAKEIAAQYRDDPPDAIMALGDRATVAAAFTAQGLRYRG